MPSVTIRHLVNLPIYRVSPCDTRQLMLYAECHRLTLGKPIFFILPPKLFVLLYYNTCCSVLKFCTFLSDFTIFRQFILVKWIFGNFLDLNCKGFEYPKKVNKKMIFLSLSLFWDRIQGQTRNFEHCVREHEQKCVAEKSENSIKSKRSLKITKFVELSWYHTRRLW